MKYIEFETKNGKENMQIDSDLLENAILKKCEEPTFRLYAWKPACVSLGRNQKDDFLDNSFLTSNNIDVVRRLTGGRGLLHDNELTYSCITPVSSLNCGESVVGSYKEISQIIIDSFNLLGIKLDFPENKKPNTKFDYCMLISTGADLCYNGKKFVGSAQFRKDGYILQHGSILIDYDSKLIEKIFGENPDKNSLTCLKDINPKLTINDIIKAFETIIKNK